MSSHAAEGPYFDELEPGLVFDTAPGVTLTEGRAAVHQAILGDRLRLALDDALARDVTGGSLASPALVWNVAIGQSTLATQHVKANLFYRNLTLLRQPAIGDTLRTTTTVAGLRENVRREGRAPTGLAALHMRTVDQEERPVLDFYRCAMLPLRGSAPTGFADDLSTIGGGSEVVPVAECVPDWSVERWTAGVGPSRPLEPGAVIEVVGGDVVSGAPELARLTTNLAAVHHDQRAGGGTRLVYGGHTIGIALAQATRALPDLVTVLAWQSCDHVGPVREGDTLRSRIVIEASQEVAGGWRLLDLRSEVEADGGSEPRPVLDWRFTALAAG
ncbi:acyl dehydratase [Nocardioides immobilis]|uniref:Acyl dehydratase n=1 Tax=Nocardioides immobilis TaxID=2049295 RepID=A0A417XZ96_9ACTN|nr:MaoC family dehydratase [Nocardioides immobilis]RHW25700.1 acyl dehydratase [Nocardioides immobilis]